MFMKKIFLLIVLVSAGLFSNYANAQVNVNLGLQPAWGPVGYNHVDYYYLPDVDAYYYVPNKKFIYLNNGNWIHSNALPVRYSNYNLYNGYKVVLNEPTPYLRYANHKIVYAKYKGNNGKQVAIKNAKGPKSNVIKKSSPVKGSPVKSNAKAKGKNNH